MNDNLSLIKQYLLNWVRFISRILNQTHFASSQKSLFKVSDMKKNSLDL